MDITKFIDIDSAKERFMNNEELYQRFLFEFPNRTLYSELKEALDNKNSQEAFEVAHKMKGLVENLSLIILGKSIREMVEVLRKGGLPDSDMEKELEEAYNQSVSQIFYIKENNIKIF